MLRTIAGSERLLSIEHVVDELPAAGHRADVTATAKPKAPEGEPATTETADWDRVCFYVTPIEHEDSEQRQHADVLLAALIEPALEELGLKVVRADQIDKPGLITTQVIEHLAKARLVVADLSFHNPNVFYELALRHASGKPTVQLTRDSDPIPFDLEQVRTIRIDTSSLYAFVPQIEVYKTEIASQARGALEAGSGESPLSVFYPEFPGRPDSG